MTKDGQRLLTLCAGPCGIYTHTVSHEMFVCNTEKRKKKKDPEELLESVRVVCLRRKKNSHVRFGKRKIRNRRRTQFRG
jgi:hypothetical protein